MDNKDFEDLINELRGTQVELPLHKKALREGLIRAHHSRTHARRRHPLSVVKNGVKGAQTLLGTRKILSVGVVIVLVGILLLGVALFHPGSHKPGSKQIIADAPHAPVRPKTSTVANIGAASPQPDASTGLAAEARQVAVSSPTMPEPMSPVPDQAGATLPPSSSAGKHETKIVVKVHGHETAVVQVVVTGNAKDDKKAIKAAIKAIKKADKKQPLDVVPEIDATLKIGGISLLLGVNSKD